MEIYSVIAGTGSYIPTKVVENKDFLNYEFFSSDGRRLDKTNQAIIEKFQEITEIAERRYISEDLLLSDVAFFAAEDALHSSNIDKESLDYIIVAHNFGDVKVDTGDPT